MLRDDHLDNSQIQSISQICYSFVNSTKQNLHRRTESDDDTTTTTTANTQSLKEWWQTHVTSNSDELLNHHFHTLSIQTRRDIIISLFHSVYLLSHLAEKIKSQSRYQLNDNSLEIKFTSETITKYLVKIFYKCRDEEKLLTDLNQLTPHLLAVPTELMISRNLATLSILSCLIIGLGDKTDAKTDGTRKFNLTDIAQILIMELNNETNSNDIKLQIVQSFQTIIETSIFHSGSLRSDFRLLMESLANSCLSLILNSDTSDDLIMSAENLLVNLTWRNVNPFESSHIDGGSMRPPFESLFNLALDHIERHCGEFIIMLASDRESAKGHIIIIMKMLNILTLLFKKGQRSIETGKMLSREIKSSTISLDRFMRMMISLAKCLTNIFVLDSLDKEKSLTAHYKLNQFVPLILLLMRECISSIESSRIAMCVKFIGEFLEKLLVMPRDQLFVIRILILGGDAWVQLFRSLSLRCPSVLLSGRESSSQNLESGTFRIQVSYAVRTKICLASRIEDKFFRLLDSFRTSLLRIEEKDSQDFFSAISFSRPDEFDRSQLLNKSVCLSSQKFILTILDCSRCLIHVLPVSRRDATENLDSDLTGIIVWWLLTGLDALLHGIDLELTIKGMNAATKSILTFSQNNKSLLSLCEGLNMINFILFSSGGAVFKAHLNLIRSLLGLDDSVPHLLQVCRLKIFQFAESLCILVKLWDDLLNSDVFRLAVEEDCILEIRTLMNQIRTKLVIASETGRILPNNLQIDLNSITKDEFNLDKLDKTGKNTSTATTLDSPLIEDIQGVREGESLPSSFVIFGDEIRDADNCDDRSVESDHDMNDGEIHSHESLPSSDHEASSKSSSRSRLGSSASSSFSSRPSPRSECDAYVNFAEPSDLSSSSSPSDSPMYESKESDFFPTNMFPSFPTTISSDEDEREDTGTTESVVRDLCQSQCPDNGTGNNEESFPNKGQDSNSFNSDLSA